MKPGSTTPSAYWLFWVMLAVMAVLFPVYTWHDDTSGFLTDDAMYLLLADFFSPHYEGNPFLHYLVIHQARFPPVFPLVIGLLGGGSETMGTAHLVVCASFIASAVALYAWASRVLDSRQTGAACLLIYALLPKTLVYVIEIWSEFLYMAMVFAVFILLDVAQRSRHQARQALSACALLIGLALLTRTIGVALLAAFVLYLLVNRVERKYLYIPIAILPPVCWKIIKSFFGYGGTYSEDLTRYMSMDGIATLVLTDIPRNASLLLESWGRHFAIEPGASWGLQGIAVLLLLLALIGWWRRAAGRQADAYYVVFYIAVVLVWPYPDHATRFLYPILVPALAYLFIGLAAVIPKTEPRLQTGFAAALLLLMLALVYPNALFVIDRVSEPLPGHIREDFRHTRQWLRGHDIQRPRDEVERRQTVISLIKRLDEHVGPRECIYAVHPPSTMLYSGRRSIILPEQASIEKLTYCRYMFVMNLIGIFGPMYPMDEIDTSRLTLVDHERDGNARPQAFLYRIQP